MDKRDMDFMNKIIVEICDYSVDNRLDVNDTLETVANNILSILEVASFANWKKEVRDGDA
jgi:hypothetical protein